MEKSVITFRNKEYTIRRINLLYTGFKNGKYDGLWVGEDALQKALDEAFAEADKDFESAAYCDAERVTSLIYTYVDDGYLQGNPTETELLWDVLQMDYMEKDLDDEVWYYLMRSATYEVAMMYEQGKVNVNCEGYECAGRYSVYCYGDGKHTRHLYDGNSAKTAAMAAIGFLSGLSMTNQYL